MRRTTRQFSKEMESARQAVESPIGDIKQPFQEMAEPFQEVKGAADSMTNTTKNMEGPRRRKTCCSARLMCRLVQLVHTEAEAPSLSATEFQPGDCAPCIVAAWPEAEHI